MICSRPETDDAEGNRRLAAPVHEFGKGGIDPHRLLETGGDLFPRGVYRGDLFGDDFSRRERAVLEFGQQIPPIAVPASELLNQQDDGVTIGNGSVKIGVDPHLECDGEEGPLKDAADNPVK